MTERLNQYVLEAHRVFLEDGPGLFYAPRKLPSHLKPFQEGLLDVSDIFDSNDEIYFEAEEWQRIPGTSRSARKRLGAKAQTDERANFVADCRKIAEEAEHHVQEEKGEIEWHHFMRSHFFKDWDPKSGWVH